MSKRSRDLPYCPQCGKGYINRSECPYCHEDLVEP